MQIALIGIQTNSDGSAGGVIHAPVVLREAGLVERLSKFADVEDYGNLSFIAPTKVRDEHSGIIAPDTLLSMIEGTADVVMQALKKDQFPLLIGGDCPLLLGCLLALQNENKKFGLLFVDGHEDAYAPMQSPTGEAADMELALALGLTKEAQLSPGLQSLFPLIEDYQVSLLGPRDKPILQREGVASINSYLDFVDDKTILSEGAKYVGQRCFNKLVQRNHSAWFHLDLDVLSTEALPAVDYQQSGGLSWEDLETLSLPFLCKDLLIGWDITIYNPDLDAERKCAKRILEFIESRISLLVESEVRVNN